MRKTALPAVPIAPLADQAQLARCLRQPPARLLLLGPSGSGKSVLARALGRGGRFEELDCASLAPAAQARALAAALRLAAGGTLYLRELCALTPAALRALAAALRGARPPRLLASTSRDLQAAIAAGALPAELGRELGRDCLAFSGLRGRRDLPRLLAGLMPPGARKTFSPGAKKFLLERDWPGNLRELRRFALLAAAAPGRVITAAEAANCATWRFF